MTTTLYADESRRTLPSHVLNEYAQLVYCRTGIRLSPHKQMILSERLHRCARKSGRSDLRDYLTYLRSLRQDHPAWNAFLQQVTNHETWLFRDEEQWQWLRHVFLPQIVAAAVAGNRPQRLRIWSAAASTGDEAFSAAICVCEAITNLPEWRVEIVGTDLSRGTLEQARLGIFGSRSMRNVPSVYRTRYFQAVPGADVWQALPLITDLVEFRQHNLLEPLLGPAFDLILLKHVMIYFDRDARQTVLAHVDRKLSSDGVIVCGPTECIAQEAASLGLRDGRRPWLFEKRS